MIIRYISHISLSDHYNWDLGDCYIAHANNQLAFYLYKPGDGNFISNSLCIEVCDYEDDTCDNMILFYYDPTKGSYGNRACLLKYITPFNNDLIKSILEQALDILSFKQESFETSVLLKVIGYNKGLQWEHKQQIFKEQTNTIPEKRKQHYGGMPTAYIINSIENCEIGREIHSNSTDDYLLCNWGRYTIHCYNGKVIINHPTFGSKKYDVVRFYNNHIVGIERTYDGSYKCVLYSASNRSTVYTVIKNECFNGYHVAFKDDDTVCLLQGSTCRDIVAPSMKWDDVIEIHSSSVVVEKSGKLNIVSFQSFNVPPRRQVADLDEVIWQKEEIYFVCTNNDWRVYNNRDCRASKQYREVRWITEELVCGTDGAGNYSIFNPAKDSGELIYCGPNPQQFIFDLNNKVALKNERYNDQQTDSPIDKLKESDNKKAQKLKQNIEAEEIDILPMSYLVVDDKYSLKVTNYMGYKGCIKYHFGNTSFFSKRLFSEKFIYFYNNDNNHLSITQYFKDDYYELLDSFEMPANTTPVISNRTPLFYIKEILFNDLKSISFNSITEAYTYIHRIIKECNKLPAKRNVVTDAILAFYDDDNIYNQNHIYTKKVVIKSIPETDKINANANKVTERSKKTVSFDSDKAIRTIKKNVDKYTDTRTVRKDKNAQKNTGPILLQTRKKKESKADNKKQKLIPLVMTNYLNKCGTNTCRMRFFDDREIVLHPQHIYNSTIFKRKVPSICDYNYYFSNNKDVVILVPGDTLKRMEESGIYEIIGSGKDPKYPQTIGNNVNGKICLQKETKARILIFAIIEPDQYMFYDEVKYVSHRIEKTEPYMNDVIHFQFESVL